MLPQETRLLTSMVFKTNDSETICIQDIKLSIRTTPVKVTELSMFVAKACKDNITVYYHFRPFSSKHCLLDPERL